MDLLQVYESSLDFLAVDSVACQTDLQTIHSASTISEDSEEMSDVDSSAARHDIQKAESQENDAASHPLRTVEGRLATYVGWNIHRMATGGRSIVQKFRCIHELTVVFGNDEHSFVY